LIVKHSEPLNLSHPCRNQQISNVAARVEAVYQDILVCWYTARIALTAVNPVPRELKKSSYWYWLPFYWELV